jgi:REP element-mobilizing transposase RayT
MEHKLIEVFVSSFPPSSNDTEQVELEREDQQTVLRDPLPANKPETIAVEEASVESLPAIEVESVLNISSGLTFSCVLIPRFDDHYLTGDITGDLQKWMKEVCISYGWHLDAMTIRPGYMHWVMTVPLTANPAHFMRVTRLQTSQKIFEYYPRFKRKNLSNDFWAPSFSVAAGSQPHSMEDIDNFIRQTRSQQGIF